MGHLLLGKQGVLVSMGVEEVSLGCLEAGVLALGVWEPARKFKGSHPTWEDQASGLGPWWKRASDQ